MKILAVDLGKARTGAAICDEREMLASPLKVIAERRPGRDWWNKWRRAQENRVKMLVVGLPENMDGSEGESAQNARAFAQRLEETSGLPVAMRDEREEPPFVPTAI